MNKKTITRSILIILVALAGPVGVGMGIFKIGDAAFSGSNNTKSITGYYLLDYITISATYNLFFIVAFALIGWIIKSRKVQLSTIINFTLIGHLFFVPSFLVSLFLTMIPVEGNIKGFIIFPAFILSAIGGIIGFLTFFIVKLLKTKKAENNHSELRLLAPYGIVISVLMLLQLVINNEGTTTIEIVSFKHDDFSWGIKQKKKSKIGMIKNERNDPYFAYIIYDNKEADTINIKLRQSYHSLFTEMDSVLSVQPKIIEYQKNKSPFITTADLNKIEIFTPKNTSDVLYYRIRKAFSPFTMYLESTVISARVASIIASDIISNSSERRYFHEMQTDLILETVALGEIKKANLQEFKNNNEFDLRISVDGRLQKKQKSTNVNDQRDSFYSQVIGQVNEGVLHITSPINNVEYFELDEYKKIDFTNYKNKNGQSITDAYTFIEDIECATNITTALKECPDIESLFLINPAYNGIQESIGALTNVSYLGAKNITIDKIPSSICKLNKLYSINFLNIKGNVSFPSCILDLKELRYVNLINCNLKKFPENFKNLKYIAHLGLHGNAIREIPNEIGNMKNLEIFSIDYHADLIIPENLILKKELRLDLVTYNKADTEAANKLLIKLGKSRDQDRNNEEISFWYVDDKSQETE